TLIGLFLICVGYHSWRWSIVLPYLAVTVIGLGYVKTISYISLVVIPLLFMMNRLNYFSKLSYTRTIRVALICVVIFLYGSLSFHIYRGSLGKKLMGNTYHRIGYGVHHQFAPDLGQYVLKHYPDQQIFTDHNVGSHLIWQWWPRKKVYIDAKNTAYQMKFRNRHFRVPLIELVREGDYQYVILHVKNPWNYLYFIPDPEWNLVVFDTGKLFYSKQIDANSTPLEKLLIDGTFFKELRYIDQLYMRSVIEFLETAHNDGSFKKMYKSPMTFRLRHSQKKNPGTPPYSPNFKTP
ncbi:MAG: hypothetical protein ABEJ65_00355, partial [bacterium]